MEESNTNTRINKQESPSLAGGTIKRLADAITKENHFALDGARRLYHFRVGVYKPGGEITVQRLVKHLLEDWGESQNWTASLGGQVSMYIGLDSPTLWERPPLNVVNLVNGLLDIETREIKPHSQNHLTTVQLPVSYDPAAQCPAIEKFVGEVFPEDATALAWEISAYLMAPDTNLQRSVLLIGSGGNGKSTWLQMLIAFVGDRNTSSISAHKLESDRFAVARIYGKLANICADLPSEHLAGTSVLKAITGGDVVTGECKFRDSFDFRPFARPVFSANSLPRSQDASQGFFDRWLVVPFDKPIRGVIPCQPERNHYQRGEAGQWIGGAGLLGSSQTILSKGFPPSLKGANLQSVRSGQTAVR